MTNRINGASFGYEAVSRNVQYYTVFVSAPYAFSDPDNVEGVNVLTTKNYKDESQKNFEILVQAISLRAMPVIMTDPRAVAELQDEGAIVLSGEGYVWKFAVELSGAFENTSSKGTPGPVGLLIDEINGIVLPSGVVLKTIGADKNIEFTRNEFL